MIMRDDLVRGLCSLTFADDARVREPQGGYAMAGLSFTPAELFAEIAERVPAFAWSAPAAGDDDKDSPARLFAALWPDSLSAEEAARDLDFTAEATTLGVCVERILAGWRERRSGGGEGSSAGVAAKEEEEEEEEEDDEGSVSATAAGTTAAAAEEEEAEEAKDDDDDDSWWQIQYGAGAAGGLSPIAVLIQTAGRMEDFREGGYEENLLVGGSSWSVGVLPAPLEANMLATVQSAGAEMMEVWEERCEALDKAGALDAGLHCTTQPAIRADALQSLRRLHRVLSEIGVSPLDLQRAAALT